MDSPGPMHKKSIKEGNRPRARAVKERCKVGDAEMGADQATINTQKVEGLT